ncbi:MAG: FUSC family protein, partial [Xanthomonadales bacterium]|nr:FUSC family protein [Xanthomonadales bacterium]
MSASAYSLRAQAVDTVLRIKRPDVPLPVALRNTLAVVLPLAVGLASGHLQAGLGIAAGSLNTMFSDQPGPY